MAEVPSRPSVASAAFLRDVLAGKAKPRTEVEAIQASSALMWKQAFEVALRPMEGDEQSPLAAPQGQAIRDAQAQWMGVEAAVAFGASIKRQMAHAQAGVAIEAGQRGASAISPLAMGPVAPPPTTVQVGK